MAIRPTNVKARWLEGGIQLGEKPFTGSEATNKKDGLHGMVSCVNLGDESLGLPILSSWTSPFALGSL
jgi:hypothetical protein